MVRRNNYTYTPIRATSRVDGTPAQDILDMYDAKTESRKKPFGKQGGASTDGLVIFIDCRGTKLFAGRVSVESRLSELKFNNDDRPSYLTNRKDNYTDEEASAIVHSVEWTGDLT